MNGFMTTVRRNRIRSNPGDPNPAGFTLIEVLVVVAILALLITILLPSLKRARDQAKVTACLTNLHDLGNAQHTYAQSNKDYFVPTPYIGTSNANAGFPGGDDNMFTLWWKRYARNADSFSCPATRHVLRTPERVEPYVESNGLPWYRVYTNGALRNDFEYLAQRRSSGGYGTSYEYNLWYDDTRSGFAVKTRITWHPYWVNRAPVDQIMKKSTMIRPNPAFSLLIHDADDGGDDGDIIGSIPAPGYPNGRAINNYPEPWDNHGTMGMNILFVDLHAEAVRRWDLAGGGGRIWNRQNRNY